jgi:glutamyl-tRNA synthetase
MEPFYALREALKDHNVILKVPMLRVRFAPSPTGYLHIGSARTFIFNWLYARHNAGAMILRIDDTDIERNTQQSLDSIFDGLKWLDLGWDEFYRQSERLDLHRRAAEEILAKGLAYRDDEGVVRFKVPRETRTEVTFTDLVYGHQVKGTADIEDFALLRSNGAPTYHMASCADDADLKISHIIRGQDHLTNTFKHVLIFEALGVEPPKFAHLPLLIAPDGSKLSKRKHGPVVSVTTYRDAGFLSRSFVNFLCLLGWSPKNDREKMSRQELIDAFTLEGVNKSNATVNFSEDDPFDPKALWLNAEHLKTLPIEELAADLLPFAEGVSAEKMLPVAPLIQERIKTLRDVATVADFFFVDKLPPFEAAELIPQKGDLAMARLALEKSRDVLASAEFNHDALDAALRAASAELKIKPGQMFQPIRVAVCGRKNSPPLFETLVVLGREKVLQRIEEALEKI